MIPPAGVVGAECVGVVVCVEGTSGTGNGVAGVSGEERSMGMRKSSSPSD